MENLNNIGASSRAVFMATISKPWIQDDLSEVDFQIISEILELVRYDKEVASRIVEMPFLDSIDGGELTILRIIEHPYLHLGRDGLSWLLSHPDLTGGISDDHGGLVALLRLEWEDPVLAS